MLLLFFSKIYSTLLPFPSSLSILLEETLSLIISSDNFGLLLFIADIKGKALVKSPTVSGGL